MIKYNILEVSGFYGATKGMRNPMNSWDKNDSTHKTIGENDLDLGRRLAKAGPDHRKFVRQIVVWVDITAPLYWWKEFDTYKVGTVANSTSTMHKLTSKPLTVNDFSIDEVNEYDYNMIKYLNDLITSYNNNKDYLVWRKIIQSLPSSYNQTRTVTLNYEVLYNMYTQRKNHKLDEWREFVDGMSSQCPYFKEVFNLER